MTNHAQPIVSQALPKDVFNVHLGWYSKQMEVLVLDKSLDASMIQKVSVNLAEVHSFTRETPVFLQAVQDTVLVDAFSVVTHLSNKATSV